MRKPNIRIGICIGFLGLGYFISEDVMAQFEPPASYVLENIRYANESIESHYKLSSGSSPLRESQDFLDIENLLKTGADGLNLIIEKDPDRALQLALPDSTIRKLIADYPEFEDDLETYVRWEGLRETVTTYDFIGRSSRTFRRLYSNGKAVEIFTGQRSSQTNNCAEFVDVEGVLLNDRSGLNLPLIKKRKLKNMITGKIYD